MPFFYLDDVIQCFGLGWGQMKERDPICGSDGESYDGPRTMRYAACMKRQAIIEVYKGECTGMVLFFQENFLTLNIGFE